MTENNCVICYETISNPICESCYLKQISSWLESINLSFVKRNLILKKIREEMVVDTLNEGNCIICGKSGFAVCSYCFFKKVAKSMKKLDLNIHLVESFLAIFNYQHGEEEYVL